MSRTGLLGIPKWMKLGVLKRDRYACRYCGRPACLSLNRLHIDHVLPVIKGGRTIPCNLVASCQSCNSKKHARVPRKLHPHYIVLCLIEDFQVTRLIRLWRICNFDWEPDPWGIELSCLDEWFRSFLRQEVQFKSLVAAIFHSYSSESFRITWGGIVPLNDFWTKLDLMLGYLYANEPAALHPILR